MIEGQKEKYATYMDEAMQALLAMVKDPKEDAKARLTAAHTMDQINDTAIHVDLMDRVGQAAVDGQSDLIQQVKKLRPKREPWQEDEDGE